MGYVKLTKPLCSGIAEFEMECVAGKRCCSIGVITNMEAEPKEWLFDDRQCGISYQLHMSEERRENALYHFDDGKEIYQEFIGNEKSNMFSSGEIAKFVLDFDRSEITFFVNDVQIGKPMQIEKGTTYYAAFTWTSYALNVTYKLRSTYTFA